MKKQSLTILLVAIMMNSFAQDTTSTKVYPNEFGIDVTNFIKQFLNFNNNSTGGNYYSPTYYLTYRRHFKCGNIRFAVGGAFSHQDIAPAFDQDSHKYESNSSSYDVRIGWEFTSEISKRWQVFYGADFRPTYSHNKNDAPYWNGGYANGSESKTEFYTAAPLLGFRFRLTSRLSLTTEASFSINWQTITSRRYYIPVTSQYPPKPDETSPTVKKMYSNFSQPIFLILTFDL